MKKAILLLTISLALIACGGGGPKDDAARMCDLRKQLEAADRADDEAEIKRIDIEGEKLEDEFKEKYKNDKAGEEEFRKELMNCDSREH